MASTPTQLSTSTTGPMLVSNEPTFANRTLVVINVATQAPLKLIDTTYFSWKKQFNALLIGYDLYGFIDGTIPCPPSVLPGTTNSPNPDFLLWVYQDSLLLSALLASLSKGIHHLVSFATTSKDT